MIFCLFLQTFQINSQIQDHVEEAARRKTWRRRTSGGEIDTDHEFGIEERTSASDAGFGCIKQPEDSRNAMSEFRSFRHWETSCETVTQTQ